MKKRDNSFFGNSKNLLIALLVVAAAVTTYTFVVAQGGGGTVIHSGSEIMIGNQTLEEELADIRALSGAITTYRMSASGYMDGSYYRSKSVSHDCPEGSTVVNVYLSQSNVNVGGARGGACDGCWSGDPCPRTPTNSCSYSISGNTATLTARIVQIYEPDCACCVGYSLTTSCYPHTVPPWNIDRYTCSIPGGCVMEFQCGKKQTVS